MEINQGAFRPRILKKGNQGALLSWNRSWGDQGAFRPRSWRKVTKGLFYLRTRLLKCRSNGFSTLIWTVEMLIKGNCWNVDQRAFLLRSEWLKCWSKGFSTLIGTVEMSIKGLFYFDLNCWNVDQMAFLPQSHYWNVDQTAFLLRFELLKCRPKGFSTLIVLLPPKSQNFGLGFKWWGLCSHAVFDMCDFHLFLLNLDITFLSRKLGLIFVVLWKRFDFWNLKLGVGNWKFWIWNLKFENLPLEILRLETWNLKL